MILRLFPLLITAFLCACSQTSPVRLAPKFDNTALEKLLANTNQGVIYLWSPHMPYSIQGAVEIQTICQQLNLPLTLLLDPNAEVPFHEQDELMPQFVDENFRPATSKAIFKIGASQHFPTLIVYRQGQLGKQLPGYVSSQIYTEFLKGWLRE